ncbi:hypothetical protein CEQ51_01875 [Pseudomonas thivervalensis]|uniref:Uncharacterized protein n=1 Tax=Pseudomonas thivervalensis TaxID=86265 RepID=A0A2Z4ZKP7_9PSED|nr:hypothetical protein CE140_01875 [Pseudomonas thivervalensis]AXA58868.1 hypothetical protein CEQ51_01875 [Pseudomonas thivervalensis]
MSQNGSWVFLWLLLELTTHQCGSEPARDSGGSACINAECTAAIASRLAPTGDLCRSKNRSHWQSNVGAVVRFTAALAG